MENFKCVICDSVGKWKNVDEFRFKKAGMCMCEKCGFITYPELCSKTDDISKYYEHDYREAPSINNLFSGERKLHYHNAFLEEYFGKWKSENKSPRILEIGSAFGLVLTWLKSVFPESEIYGTELTKSFIRNAWHRYKIKLEKEPDFSKKYDLIISYKVAEHIPGIDVQLRKYAEALSENGILYISVPTWFGELSNPGLQGLDLEFYYDTNHVNVWSRKLFEQLLKKCGLKILKENHIFYGDTYACTRDDSTMQEPLVFDDPAKRLEELSHIFTAVKFALEGKYEQALLHWPNFPEAQVNAYETSRSKVHGEGFESIKEKYIDRALSACPGSSHVSNFCADLYMRYERFEAAINQIQTSLNLRPQDPSSLMMLGHCFRQMAELSEKNGDKNAALAFRLEAQKAMKHLQKVSKQCLNDAVTWEMQDNARIPTPFENNELNPS